MLPIFSDIPLLSGQLLIDIQLACEAAGYPEWKGEYNIECFKNSDPDNVAYKDLSLDNWINRQWNWMLCNEP